MSVSDAAERAVLPKIGWIKDTQRLYRVRAKTEIDLDTECLCLSHRTQKMSSGRLEKTESSIPASGIRHRDTGGPEKALKWFYGCSLKTQAKNR